MSHAYSVVKRVYSNYFIINFIVQGCNTALVVVGVCFEAMSNTLNHKTHSDANATYCMLCVCGIPNSVINVSLM